MSDFGERPIKVLAGKLAGIIAVWLNEELALESDNRRRMDERYEHHVSTWSSAA